MEITHTVLFWKQKSPFYGILNRQLIAPWSLVPGTIPGWTSFSHCREMSLHSNPVTHSISILIESMFLSVSNGSHKLQFNLGKFADFVFQGSGTGSFNWTSVAEAAKAIPESFNLVNPPMRGLFSSNIPNLLLRRLILDISRYFYNTPCFSRPKLVGNSLSWCVIPIWRKAQC